MKRAGLLLAAALLAGCGGSKTLPVYSSVPQFSLTGDDGKEFRSSALSGRIWVADFMFTTCTGPCPRMASQMRWLAKQVADLPQVRFVSFTIDPEHDTPPVLAEYAGHFRDEPGRWFFLTGPHTTLQQLNRDAFKLGDVDGSLTHSTRFVLIDGQGRIRGYYETSGGTPLEPLVADIRTLARGA